ncbi:MAG: hypothetical protein HYW38_02150 [Candidatus Colwellbacteria bacterium]|nr:hypothetical protein [Candidatus Colwellbacteria bacterium]
MRIPPITAARHAKPVVEHRARERRVLLPPLREKADRPSQGGVIMAGILVPPRVRDALRKYVEAPEHCCLSLLQVQSFQRLEEELPRNLVDQVRRRSEECRHCNRLFNPLGR